MGVAAAQVHRSIHYRRRRLQSDLIVNAVVLSRLERPLLLPGFGVDGIEITVPTPDVDRAVYNRWRGVHHVLGGELPLQHSGLGVGGVDVAIAAAEIDLAVRHG